MDYFLPFYLPNSLKNQNFKNIKKCLEIPSFYNSVAKIMMICYTVPEIWCVTDIIVIFHFGLFFALLPLNSPKNQNFKKMKQRLEISSFYICVPKIMIRWCTIPEIWCVVDGQTEGKSDIYRWVSHLKKPNQFVAFKHIYLQAKNQLYSSIEILRFKESCNMISWDLCGQ